MSISQTISATQFKAKCLDILERLGSGRLDRVEVTKRGRVMAVLTPPPALVENVDDLFGCLKSQTLVREGVDLTEAVSDEPFIAEDGALHA